MVAIALPTILVELPCAIDIVVLPHASAKPRLTSPESVNAKCTTNRGQSIHNAHYSCGLGDCGQRFASCAAPDRFGALIIAQLALAAEPDASGLREPPKWLNKAPTVRKTMSGERQNALQTAR